MTTTFPFTLCCQMLGVAPKTLRHWLSAAGIEPTGQGIDSRLKLLTLEQVYQLAILHRRSITPSVSSGVEANASRSALQTEEEPFALEPIRDLVQGQERHGSLLKEEEVRDQLRHLESRLATVQEQLTHLSLLLVQERDLRYERRLTTLEALVQHIAVPHSLSPTFQAVIPSPKAKHRPAPGRQPAEKRPRPLLPLIEYGASGTYVVICPKRGELPLTPDSPEWFAWLDTLPSFRFVGKLGRLTAHRSSQYPPGTTWRAHRQIRNHTYNHRLGKTACLTIATLEQAAAALQSHLK